MGYASLSGRAVTNPDNPKAFGRCDRCNFWYNHCDLSWQMDYRGRNLVNIRILICSECNDIPNEQLKPRIIPPDPVPIANARTETYLYDESNNRYTSALPERDFFTGIPLPVGENRITQNMENRTTQQTGTAPTSRNMFPGIEGYQVPDDLGLPYDYTGVPNTGIIVEEVNYAYWLSDTTNPTWWRNNEGFGIYWSGTSNF